MTFEEWTATYCNCMLREGDTAEDRLTRLVARDAWKAAEAATREDMLTQWNRAGVDIDAALHGRVNKESPIANRLRMIAAAAQGYQESSVSPCRDTYEARYDADADDPSQSERFSTWRAAWHAGNIHGMRVSAAQPKWQPIATAPLIGKILVYTKGGRLSVAYWCADEWNRRPKPYWQMQCHFNISQSRLDQPIHWMPLPEPPSATGEKEQEARDVTK